MIVGSPHTHCCSDLLLTLGRQRNLLHLVEELRSQDKINKDHLNVNRVILVVCSNENIKLEMSIIGPLC